jgi:RimJ/RimL family protein N-acetyltransferase
MALLREILQLRTQRLAFLLPSNNDLFELYSFFSNPSQTYFLFLPPGTPQQQQDFWVSWNYSHWRSNRFGMCALRSQVDGALLGMCGLIHQYIDGHLQYEMSCFILPHYQRQGLATEALQTLGDFLTNTSRHSLFNNLLSAQLTTYHTSWSIEEDELDREVVPVVMIPERNPAARRIAAKLNLIPGQSTLRGNERYTLAYYLPQSAR